MNLHISGYELILQSIGVLGIICSIISFQCKKHNHIMLFRTLCEGFFAVQYFLLGAYTGTMMNICGCIRNQIFSSQVKKGKSTLSAQIIFSILFIVSGIFTWQGLKSVIIIFAKVLSTVGYGIKNLTLLRCFIFITSSCWLIYNIIVKSYAGVCCEAFTLCSIITALIRMDLIPKIKKQ